MDTKQFLILGGILIGVVILFSMASSGGGGSSMQQRGDPKYKITITSDTVGLEYITLTNENTGANIRIQPTELPFTGNFAKNDILTIEVLPKTNYAFNAWIIDDGTWESDNPLAIKPSGSLEITARLIPIRDG
jgi:hypothetical protein